jgi:hypothetical protein
MSQAAFAILLLLAEAAATGRSANVSIRSTTAAISVTGGASDVSATLYDASGKELDGLLVEREASRSAIVLVVSVRPGARIEARVPSRTDLRIEASNGGPVTVRGVTGQLEILNSNAGIVLERVGGTILASTSNGAIDATIDSVDPRLPMSFLTTNGHIDVTFPESVKANLRVESDTGPISTDFELVPIGIEPMERKIMRGGKLRTVRYGAVNGGGPQIDVRTENASIDIRRRRK